MRAAPCEPTAENRCVAARVSTARGAAAFVDGVGIALAFPSNDLVAPSLWEAAFGTREVTVFTVEPGGRKVLTEELRLVWRLKNELAERRLACVGKHVRGRVAAISPALLPARYALTGRDGDEADFRGAEEGLALELAEALLAAGPETAPGLRRLVPAGAREAKRALEGLQRRLVVTQAGEEPQDHGWDAGVFDLVARRYDDRLRPLPPVEDARSLLATAVLQSAGEVSAADVAAVIGSTVREAADALARLEEQRRARRLVDSGHVLWRAKRR